MTSKKIVVECGPIQLKLTLTPKWLGKSLQDAVITPFLGAYNKRSAVKLDVAELLRVEVDGTPVSDWSAPAESILTNENPRVVLVAPLIDEPTTKDANEVQRVLSARNEFEVLGLPLEAVSETAVRKAYRKVSLQVHPDKIEDTAAPEAFRHVRITASLFFQI